MHAAKADHDQCRQQVQRHALGGTRLHARRARDRFGTGVEPDWTIGLDEQRSRAVIGDANSEGAPLFCLAHAGDGEGRRSACGHRDDDVGSTNSILLDQSRGLIGRVFGTLDRSQQRVLAAGHQKQKTVLRPIEGRDKFSPILDGEPTGRASAYVN